MNTLYIGSTRSDEKNYRTEPEWLSGTVVERNEPLSYLIKVSAWGSVVEASYRSVERSRQYIIRTSL